MIRKLVAAIALVAASPAAAAPADPAVAEAFAHAWLDAETTGAFAGEALRLKLERCVKAGSLTEEQVAAIRPGLMLYLTTYVGGIGRVQHKVADKAAQVLSTNDLRQITTVIASPLFRQVRSQGLVGMAQTMVPRIQGCGDEAKPMDISELSTKAIKRLTSAQIAKLRTFVLSPIGQRFNSALPQLATVMQQAYRDEAVNAMLVAGGTPEMADKVRQMPALITMGASGGATPAPKP